MMAATNRTMHTQKLQFVSLLILLNLLPLFIFAQASVRDKDHALPAAEDVVIKGLHFRNTDIRDVLRSLAKAYNLNMVIDNQLQAQVTLNLTEVNLFDALNYLVREYSLQMDQIGNIYKISPCS